MPDALSKTIPIWCCVLNRALYPKDTAHHGLHTPPQVVSLSENAQIVARIDQFVDSFLALDINLEPLKQHISKPIRPVWITPESEITATEQVFQDYHPLICCTASRRVTGGEVSGGGYIQGSGDDTENWAFGLTPPLFWANTEVILSTPEDALPDLITRLIGSQEASSMAGTLSPISPTSSLHIGSLSSLPSQNLDQIIIIILPDITDSSTWQVASNKLEIGIGTQKIGSRNLRAALPSIIDFVLNVRSKMEASPSIFIACSGGKDHSVGVALSLLCLLYDASGTFVKSTKNTDIDKAFIRKRLGWIMTSMPDANPSRATLQSVNSYLMEKPS
jgi:tRNA A64-2'-O-ribosylphosphate transferase